VTTDIETAIESFRDAAILPDRWTQALDQIARACHSEGATVVLVPTTRAADTAVSSELRPHVRDHLFGPIRDRLRDERVHPDLRYPFMPDFAYASQQEIARDPYYQEFLAPRGLGWNCTAALTRDMMICVKRGSSRGPYEGADLQALNAALPWLRAMSRTARMTWHSGFSGQLSAFERAGRGALLLDRRGCLLQANRCAKFGDGLDVVNGMLYAPRAAERHKLQQFLAAVIDNALSHSQPKSRTIALARPSGLRPWLLDGIACTDAVRSLHSRAAALVLVTDLEAPLRPSHQALHQLFGFTPVESRLACALLAGHSLQQAATSLAISEGHARQRLKAIFAKTGTARQAELTALLAKLG
jgi:DNA-binding CsgD family transcriptional regulator